MQLIPPCHYLGTGLNLNLNRGDKLFELSNHLGNVLVTVNDKKMGISSNSTNVDYFNAQVASAQDYYPFGMLQPGRSVNVGGDRFGFNGKENDNEVKGEGNQQDYGMRVYDPRLGRFLSVDPLTKGYPELTPYQFASNTPISAIDLDGEEAKVITIFHGTDNQEILKVERIDNFEVDEPFVGTLVTIRHSNGTGHVGIVTARNGNPIAILGGNQAIPGNGDEGLIVNNKWNAIANNMVFIHPHGVPKIPLSKKTVAPLATDKVEQIKSSNSR